MKKLLDNDISLNKSSELINELKNKQLWGIKEIF
jgi:hypothetical protein